MEVNKTALVLEGGGMRGMFSAGVFEAFYVRGLIFPYITAVSAGACNILSYMSGQHLRNRKIIERFATDDRYFSLKGWLKTGSIFGFDFIFGDIPEKLLPFDHEAFLAYPGELAIAATDIRSKESVWYGKQEQGKDFLPLQASSSMPFFANIVHLDGRDLMDGALLAPIPYEKAAAAGYEKFVVVLTRNAGYRKKSAPPKPLLKAKYKDYPRLWEIMEERPALYNRQLEAVEALEREGKAVIIRPQIPLDVDKLDVKRDKLLSLHDHGIGCGLDAYPKILELMEK